MLNFKNFVLNGLAGPYRKFLGMDMKKFGNFTRPNGGVHGIQIFSKGLSHFKWNGTHETLTLSRTVFLSLALGAVHFVGSVSWPPNFLDCEVGLAWFNCAALQKGASAMGAFWLNWREPDPHQPSVCLRHLAHGHSVASKGQNKKIAIMGLFWPPTPSKKITYCTSTNLYASLWF